MKPLHQKIRIVSLISFVIASICTFLGVRADNEGIITYSILLMTISFLAIITSFAIQYENRKWIRKAALISLILLPVLTFLTTVIYANYNFPPVFVILILFLTFLLSVIYISVFSKDVALTWTVAFILFLITGIIFKRYHLNGASVLITGGCATLGIGVLMFGIRCLFIVEKSPYLRNIAFLGSILSAVGFIGLLFKIQHWAGGGYLLNIANISMILGTIIVLLTLPSSGYIDWQPQYKKIFRKILLPWILIFVLFIVRFMFPDVHNMIWGNYREKKEAPFGFEMKDYPVGHKNGLKMD